MVSQGLLFSEPSVAETGVWCALSEGIDPAQWARACRYLGTLKPKEFEHILDTIMSIPCRHNRMISKSNNVTAMPLVSIGPSGIGGQFQQEHF